MKARRMTQRMLIQQRIEWAKKWLEAHGHRGLDEVVARKRAVAALDPETATPAHFLATGDGSPTAFCDGCNEWFGEVVEVGAESDYESSTATLCEDCAKEAAAMFGYYQSTEPRSVRRKRQQQMKDIQLILKEEHENPFHHGWLARHFGWPRDAVLGGIEQGRGLNKISDELFKCQQDGWIDGWDTANETDEAGRDAVVSRIMKLMFG